MRAFYALVFCMLLVACKDDKTKDNTTYLPSSKGDLNSLSIVIDNTLWASGVGDNVREIFAVPLNGLPVEELMFILNQIPPQVFDSLPSHNRILLKIDKGIGASSTKITHNIFAKPQTVVTISCSSDQDIITQLKENKNKIIDVFNKEEVREKQRLINKSLLNDEKMESQLDFTVNIPSVYRIAKSEDDFFWIIA